MIDFHLHTNASDGALSLEELVKKAEEAGLHAIAITDHDTVQNARRIKDLETSLDVIPGIEISVYDNKLNYIDLHVLGLFIDPENPKLLSILERIKEEREDQKKDIIAKLNELGYEISFEDAKKHAYGSVGRPHIGRALMEKYPKEFPRLYDVFDKLLGEGKPAFKARTAFFCLEDSIKIIHEVGGLAILAHPITYSKYDLRKLLQDFKKLGGDGIESRYDYAGNYPMKGYTESDNKRIIDELHALAVEFGFLESGGSDFHDFKRATSFGKFKVPDQFLEMMKRKLNP